MCSHASSRSCVDRVAVLLGSCMTKLLRPTVRCSPLFKGRSEPIGIVYGCNCNRLLFNDSIHPPLGCSETLLDAIALKLRHRVYCAGDAIHDGR